MAISISNSMFDETTVDGVTDYINSLLRMAAINIMSDKEAFDLSVSALAKYAGALDITTEGISVLRNEVECAPFSLDSIAKMVHFSHSYVAWDKNGCVRSFSEMPVRNTLNGVWRLENKEADSRVVMSSVSSGLYGMGCWEYSLHKVVDITNVPRAVKLVPVSHADIDKNAVM